MATRTTLGTQAVNKKAAVQNQSSNLQGYSGNRLGGVQGYYVSPLTNSRDTNINGGIDATPPYRSGITPYQTALDYALAYGPDTSHQNLPAATVDPKTGLPLGGNTEPDTGGGSDSEGGGSGGSPSSSGSRPSGVGLSFEQGYIPTNDPAYMEALNALTNLTGNAPTYTPSYDEQLNDLYNRIIGRGPFAYDLNTDPFYEQYRNQAVDTGRLAMADSMGQAAALTGGYGSSYGAQVGQQQYDAYMKALNEQVPEFYNAAYNRWLNEGNTLEEQYALTQGMADDEYNRYRDSLADYYNQLDAAANRENLLYNRGYQQNADANSARSDARDRLLNLMLTTGYEPTQADLSAAGMSSDEAAAWRQYYIASITPASTGGSGGGSSGGGSGGGSSGGSVKLNFKADDIDAVADAYVNGGEAALTRALDNLFLRGYSDDELEILGSTITNNYTEDRNQTLRSRGVKNV